jgi:hypothetical protein
MKINLLTLIILTFILNTRAQTAEETVYTFFEALSNKDIETLDQVTFDDLQLHSLTVSDKVLMSSTTKNKFLEGFKKIPENIIIEERVFEIKSMISEHLAQFEVPYEFYVNDKLSHSGINVLTLLKTDKGWKISYIADTRKKS